MRFYVMARSLVSSKSCWVRREYVKFERACFLEDSARLRKQVLSFLKIALENKVLAFFDDSASSVLFDDSASSACFLDDGAWKSSQNEATRAPRSGVAGLGGMSGRIENDGRSGGCGRACVLLARTR